MLIWYWEREGGIHDVVERAGVPAALHLTDRAGGDIGLCKECGEFT